jgi:tRNA nucleotidyltransferase/poly(A) polymerase
MSSDPYPPIEIKEYLPHLPEKPPIWLVGGVPRDHLLGRLSKDFDFVVQGDARKLARDFANRLDGAYYDLDRERDIGRVILTDREGSRVTFDFARLRGSTIEDDLLGRDFTINAIAVRLTEPFTWIDPLGGAQDIQAKLVQACTSHSLQDDPVRALRAIRFAISLGFQITNETKEGIEQTKDEFESVSAERVRDEIMLICDMPHPGKAFRLLDYMGVLCSVFPELNTLSQVDLTSPYEINAWDHTLAVLDRLGDLLSILGPVHDPQAAGKMLWAETALRLGRFRLPLTQYLGRSLSHANCARQILFFTTLYHAIGVSSDVENGARLAEKRARELRLSKNEIDQIGCIVRHQDDFEAIGYVKSPDPRTIYRYFRKTYEAGVEIALLALADFLGSRAAQISQDEWAERVGLARNLLEAYFENRERFINPPNLIDGEDIMHVLRVGPGPVIGKLLEVVREAQAAGEVTTRDDAISLVRSAHDSRGAVEVE